MIFSNSFSPEDEGNGEKYVKLGIESKNLMLNMEESFFLLIFNFFITLSLLAVKKYKLV